MSDNSNLNRAMLKKHDEFYTLYEDIEKEVMCYAYLFKNQKVFCNCDTENSNFVKFFKANFHKLSLAEFYYSGINTNLGGVEGRTFEQTEQLIDDFDIIVTNPPFSKTREFMTMLFKYNKKFLIVNTLTNVVNSYYIDKLINNEFWLGYNSINKFIDDNGNYRHFGNIVWFTNLKRISNPKIELKSKYQGNENNYPVFDGTNIINVNKIKDIPCDYYGLMGVPITYMQKHNAKQFMIVGMIARESKIKSFIAKPYIQGKAIFNRIVIKRIN